MTRSKTVYTPVITSSPPRPYVNIREDQAPLKVFCVDHVQDEKASCNCLWYILIVGVVILMIVLGIFGTLLYFARGSDSSEPIIPHKGPYTGEFLINRFKSSKFGKEFKDFFGIGFSVNRDIEILGFGFYGSNSSQFLSYNGYMQLYSHKLQQVLSDKHFEVSSNESVILMPFDNPVAIKSEELYSAVGKFLGPPTNYGVQGMEKVDSNTIGGRVIFEFHPDPFYEDSPVETGQLPQFLFRL